MRAAVLRVERLVHRQRPSRYPASPYDPRASSRMPRLFRLLARWGWPWGSGPLGRALVHRQGTLEVPPRLAVRALRLEQAAQVVQAAGQVGVALRVAILGVERSLIASARSRYPRASP